MELLLLEEERRKTRFATRKKKRETSTVEIAEEDLEAVTAGHKSLSKIFDGFALLRHRLETNSNG